MSAKAWEERRYVKRRKMKKRACKRALTHAPARAVVVRTSAPDRFVGMVDGTPVFEPGDTHTIYGYQCRSCGMWGF